MAGHLPSTFIYTLAFPYLPGLCTMNMTDYMSTPLLMVNTVRLGTEPSLLNTLAHTMRLSRQNIIKEILSDLAGVSTGQKQWLQISLILSTYRGNDQVGVSNAISRVSLTSLFIIKMHLVKQSPVTSCPEVWEMKIFSPENIFGPLIWVESVGQSTLGPLC